MMKFKYLLVALPLAILAGSCKKELDFSYHDIDPIPVAEAYLSQNGTELTLTLTTPMDEPMDLRRLKDAEVTLYNIDQDDWVVLEADTGLQFPVFPAIIIR